MGPRDSGPARVEAVFRSHGGQLWRAVVAVSAGRTDIADDVVAEAFARLLAYEEGVRDPVAWLFRTAFRLASEELRRGRRDLALIGEDGAAPASRLLSAELTSALQALTPSQRATVFLHYYAGMSVREISALTGSSSAAVKVQLHRGRRALRGTLEQEETPRG